MNTLQTIGRAPRASALALLIAGSTAVGCNGSESTSPAARALRQPPPPDRPDAARAQSPAAPAVPDTTAAADLYDPELYVTTRIADPARRALVEYGKALAEQTHRYIGPQAEDPSMRLSGNNLACKNCHLDAGLRPLSAPWVGVAQRYPNFRSRENRVGTLPDRINGCMERSMNGKPLPPDGREMRALVAWMEWLSHRAPADGKVDGAGFERFAFPARAVDLTHGKAVYDTKCAACHGADAKGQPNPIGGYFFPPLAGEDSYNVGAGMNRVLTAAAFIHNNMPLGATHQTQLVTNDEAFDVAGYIDHLARPAKVDLELDFPDRKQKPMSTPYGPWDDAFSAEQHRYGPFQPIHDYYVQAHSLDKKK